MQEEQPLQQNLHDAYLTSLAVGVGMHTCDNRASRINLHQCRRSALHRGFRQQRHQRLHRIQAEESQRAALSSSSPILGMLRLSNPGEGFHGRSRHSSLGRISASGGWGAGIRHRGRGARQATLQSPCLDAFMARGGGRGDGGSASCIGRLGSREDRETAPAGMEAPSWWL